MATVRIPGVKPVRKRLASGVWTTYLYHRKTGHRLPGEPGSVQFAQALADLNAEPPKTDESTFAWLVERYYESAAFQSLKPSSRANYRIYIDDLKRRYGTFPVSGVTRQAILELRDDLADKPVVANYTLKLLRPLLDMAVDKEMLPFNPMRAGTKIKVKHTATSHKPWPDEAIETFLEKAPADMRLALLLGLGTGQRVGDVVRMTWKDYDGTGIAVAQQKTGTKLWVPVHKDVKAALDTTKRDAVTILVAPTGKPFTVKHLQKRLRATLAGMGIRGLTFHGLRHTAATWLADSGSDNQEIMSITGHKSEASVRVYTATADQRKGATRAIKRMSKAKWKPSRKPSDKM